MNDHSRPPAVDEAQENRPGVPMELRPHALQGSHWVTPEAQPPAKGTLHRPDIDAMTPVFGTCQPLKGFSGLIRRAAYSQPETLVRHWMLLLLADRVDVMETRLTRVGKSFGVAAVLGFVAWAAVGKLRSA